MTSNARYAANVRTSRGLRSIERLYRLGLIAQDSDAHRVSLSLTARPFESLAAADGASASDHKLELDAWHSRKPRLNRRQPGTRYPAISEDSRSAIGQGWVSTGAGKLAQI